MHAAEGENGELWTRVGDRCLSAFRQLKNIEVHYLIALRESGAVYYAAAMEGAHGVAAVPMMRPIAIDPFNGDALVYAGVHQCVLGQIGFRVDTRVHAIQIQHLEDFARPFGTAHAGDSLTENDNVGDMAELGGIWRALHGNIHRTVAGALTRDDHAMAILDAGASSGLVHVLVDTGQAAAAAGLVWRGCDREN
ncbi:MAG: DNA-binding protein, partial [Mesorhizobium sp.]